jgi:hypothetical protein
MHIQRTYRLLFPLTVTIPALINRQFWPIRTIVLSFTKSLEATKVEAGAKTQHHEMPMLGGAFGLSIPGISPDAIILNIATVGYETTVTLVPPAHTASVMLRILKQGDEANLEANLKLIHGKMTQRLLPISNAICAVENGWVREGETGLFILGTDASLSPLEAKYVPSDWK